MKGLQSHVSAGRFLEQSVGRRHRHDRVWHDRHHAYSAGTQGFRLDYAASGHSKRTGGEVECLGGHCERRLDSGHLSYRSRGHQIAAQENLTMTRGRTLWEILLDKI